MAKPDCVHCAFMARQQSSEYRCQQHNMTLHTPVSVFCKNITPKVDDETYQQWFDDAIDTQQLTPNTLYTWVTTAVQSRQDETEIAIDAEALANFATYADWAAGLFWKALRDVRKKKQDTYRKKGFRVTE